jgi:hypothetical protein
MNIFPFNVPVFTFEILPAMNDPVGAKLKVLIARWLLSLKWKPTVLGDSRERRWAQLIFGGHNEPTCESPMRARARKASHRP